MVIRWENGRPRALICACWLPVPFGKYSLPPHCFPTEVIWGVPASSQDEGTVHRVDIHFVLKSSKNIINPNPNPIISSESICCLLAQRHWTSTSQHWKSWEQPLQPDSVVAWGRNATGQMNSAHLVPSQFFHTLALVPMLGRAQCPGRARPDWYRDRAETPHTTHF